MAAAFFTSFWKKVVPPPAFLLMEGAGLEVSEHSIKYLSLRKENGGFSIASFGNAEIARGVISGGEIKDASRLEEALRAVAGKLRSPLVFVSLPEQKGYLFQIALERVAGRSPRETLEFLLEEHVPLAPGEAVFDFEMIEHDDGSLAAHVTAFPRKTVEGYHEALVRAGFLPLSFEMESQAAARALTPQGDMATRVVVDFGETRTAVSIVERGRVRFTTSLDIAGVALTQALTKSLGVDAKEAERLKNEEGIAPGRSGTKVAEALMTTISALRDEISRHFIFWRTHLEHRDEPHGPIEDVILVGGNANVRGLPEYLEQSLQIPVRLGNVWGNVCDLGARVPPIPRNESYRYATVAGLALRSKLS